MATYNKMFTDPRPFRVPERLMPWDLEPLWSTCDSDDTERMRELIDGIDRPLNELLLEMGISDAVKNNRLVMVRYLLGLGVFFSGGDVITALRKGEEWIPMLEIFREFGWGVNDKLGRAAITALWSVNLILFSKFHFPPYVWSDVPDPNETLI
jgi:hypothetical protein